jgi:cell division septum initiation protein DivIVA
MHNMTDRDSDGSSSSEAMNRVLKAEREAGEVIAACRQESRDILQAAQRHANRIAGRADERISRMQMRSARQVAGRILELESEARRADRQPEGEFDETGLRECIEEIAACLTGGAGTAGMDERGD